MRLWGRGKERPEKGGDGIPWNGEKRFRNQPSHYKKTPTGGGRGGGWEDGTERVRSGESAFESESRRKDVEAKKKKRGRKTRGQ